MYQHPAALDANARYYQEEALRDAANRRLAHEANPDGHTTAHHTVVAALIAILMTVALVVLL